MKISYVNPESGDELDNISQLAKDVWWPTYHNFLPIEQIQTMLENNYSPASIKEQIKEGHHFVMLYADSFAIGFLSFHLVAATETMRIEKLYIAPAFHGKKGGAKLLQFVTDEAKKQGATTLELNVNRHNPARYFYEKQGFSIIREADIPYGKFMLEDYIMQKPL